MKQAILRENSVKYPRRTDPGINQSNDENSKNGENFVDQKAAAAAAAAAGGRGFINFSKAKERQKTIFASGRSFV